MALTNSLKKHFMLTLLLVLAVGFVAGMFTEKTMKPIDLLMDDDDDDEIDEGVEGMIDKLIEPAKKGAKIVGKKISTTPKIARMPRRFLERIKETKCKVCKSRFRNPTDRVSQKMCEAYGQC